MKIKLFWLLRKNLLKLFSILSLSIYLIGCSWDKIAQIGIYPTKSVNKTRVPKTPPNNYQNVRFNAKAIMADGKIQNMNIHGWFYENKTQPNTPVLIFFHGNGVNLGSFLDSKLLQLFESLNCHFVLVDYPGYGRSTGIPSEASLAATADSTVKWAKRRLPKSQIFPWGHSLGAAVVFSLAARNQSEIAGLAATSVWTSLWDVAKFHYKILFKNISKPWRNANFYNVVATAKTLRLPIIIHHGNADKIIPISMGQAVFNALEKGTGKFIKLNGKGHNDVFGDRRVWKSVKHLLHNKNKI